MTTNKESDNRILRYEEKLRKLHKKTISLQNRITSLKEKEVRKGR